MLSYVWGFSNKSTETFGQNTCIFINTMFSQIRECFINMPDTVLVSFLLSNKELNWSHNCSRGLRRDVYGGDDGELNWLHATVLLRYLAKLSRLILSCSLLMVAASGFTLSQDVVVSTQQDFPFLLINHILIAEGRFFGFIALSLPGKRALYWIIGPPPSQQRNRMWLTAIKADAFYENDGTEVYGMFIVITRKQCRYPNRH